MVATPTRALDATTASSSKSPRLRSSCEDCGNAKVKCDRGHPKCSRCISLGLSCVYGISRQFGKPRRKRPGANGGVGNSSPNKKRAMSTARGSDINTATGHAQPEDINRSEQLGFPDLETEIPKEPPRTNPPPNIYQNQGTALITPLSIDVWPQFDFWGPGLEFPSLSNGPAEGPASNQSASFDGPNSHSCPRGSYELFRDLICPSPFLHAPKDSSDIVSAQLDEVLHFNREAIDRLSQLLSCPCAKSGHRVMVNASIISRILIWYQQAAGWTSIDAKGSPSNPLMTSPLSTSTSSSQPEIASATDAIVSPTVQSTGFAVSQVPVSMGTFNIEDQNLQAAIRNQLILSELKRIAKSIDFFTSQGCSESSDHGVSGLYSHLGTWLRSEHSTTVRILRGRLRILNRALES